jgi:hypothetical protein
MNYTLQIAPGKTEPIEVEGDFFAVVSSPVDLLIREGGKEECLFGQGDSRTLPAGQIFKYLEVKNPTLNTVIVIMDAGSSRYEQRRQSVMEPKTRVRAYSGLNSATLPSNTQIELSGAPLGDEIRRKAVTASNDDANANLKLLDADGLPFATVYAGFPIIYPISEKVYLANKTNAPINYSAGEIFWIV